jgi:Transposase DDE domain
VGANPVDRGKPGTKLHLVCDGDGLPLTAVVTAANVNDTTMFQAVLDDVPPIRTPSGRRRTRPATVQADKGYDSRATGPICGVGDHRADRPAWDGVIGQAWTPPLAGGADAVVVELLQAAAGALGPGCETLVRVRAGGVCGGVLQPAPTLQGPTRRGTTTPK